ncbi:hypothetical protein [Nonomuraea rhizosphaerae]|nr:hypothetical protein [Nonomuraea rhizosphaerae]
MTAVEVSKRAGVMAVGFVNRPEKDERLDGAGADPIVTSMGDLADAL